VNHATAAQAIPFFNSLLVVTPAEAACEQADLAGQWAMFMYGDNFETADLRFIFGCTAIINRSGRFNSRSHCPSAELRGSFEVNRGCTVVGVFTLRFDDGFNNSCGISAAVTPNHEMISGVAACESSEILMFNMVQK
jgi:hypothetical protein